MTDLAFLSFCALVGCVFVPGGFMKGVVGLGLPTIAMGLLMLRWRPARGLPMKHGWHPWLALPPARWVWV